MHFILPVAFIAMCYIFGWRVMLFLIGTFVMLLTIIVICMCNGYSIYH